MIVANDDLTITDEEIKGVADRLRKSREEAEENRFDLGIQYGMEWASEYAEWEDLSELVDLVGTQTWIRLGYFKEFFDGNEDPELYGVAIGERNNFTYGLVEGAKRIYEKVLPLMSG